MTFLHRWLGVLLGLFFAMWFFSGMVMMYVPFPSISDRERLIYLPEINLEALNVSAAEALVTCGAERVTKMRVISINSRPTYVCDGEDGTKKGIYADDGTLTAPIEESYILARKNAVMQAPVSVITKTEFDQWTVHQRFDGYRPLYRLELNDELGTNLYFSSVTGELVQRTTAHQRFWNYIGAVPHWIYPTILRKNWALWDAVVWWISLFAIVTAVLGVYLGFRHWIRALVNFRSKISPFRGWLRWHHIMGLFTGLIIVSWIFSGWLSMDHGRIFSTPNPTVKQMKALYGGSLAEVISKINTQNLISYKGVKEITLHAFSGEPIMIAKSEANIVNAPNLRPKMVAEAVADAFPKVSIDRWEVVQANDTYTDLLEGSLPSGTIRVELSDPKNTWLHIDHRSGEILTVMDRSRRVYRWLYNGLHSLDFPGLSGRRPLWDILMIVLLSAGFIASVTGVVLGVRRSLSLFSK